MNNRTKVAVSLLLSLLLALGCLRTPAFAETLTITQMTPSTQTGSITLTQQLNEVEQLGIAGGPVQGVEYTLVQIGSLCDITYSGGWMTGYAVEQSVANKLQIAAPDDTGSYKSKNYYIFTEETDLQAIQKQLEAVEQEDWSTLITGLSGTTKTTDDQGKAVFSELPYGLYLIVQTDITSAVCDGKPITLSHQQSPMFLSVPNGTQSDVQLEVKTPLGYGELEKNIVGVGNVDGEWEDVQDATTEVTGPGDVIRFKLSVRPPSLGSKDTLDHFSVEDILSKGLDLQKLESITDSLGQSYAEDTDYTVTITEDLKSTDLEDSEQSFVGGTRLWIAFTAQGLTKLEQLARASGSLSVLYTAMVNDQAAVGGATNIARMDHKVNYAPEEGDDPPPRDPPPRDDPPPKEEDKSYRTRWEIVRSFTFDVNLTKYLGQEGNLAPQGSVTFALYKLSDGEKVPVLLQQDGEAYLAATDGSNELTVGADGSFRIRGLSEGTYYLRELATAEGYALPDQDIELILVGEQAAGEYTGQLDSSRCAVNGEQGSVSIQDNVLYLAIVNPQTFYIPNTGGAGTWMFTAGGLVIVVAGFVYLAVSRKKKE